MLDGVDGGRAYVVEDYQLVRPASFVVADAEEDAVAHHGGDQLLQEQHQEYPTYHGEVEVVDLE